MGHPDANMAGHAVRYYRARYRGAQLRQLAGLVVSFLGGAALVGAICLVW